MTITDRELFWIGFHLGLGFMVGVGLVVALLAGSQMFTRNIQAWWKKRKDGRL